VAEVRQDTAEDRFELVIDGQVAGFSAYQQQGDSIVFTHTEISPDRQEHGLGGQLVQGSLDQVRDNTELRVVAQCPFVAHWLTEHEDYQDLLTR